MNQKKDILHCPFCMDDEEVKQLRRLVKLTLENEVLSEITRLQTENKQLKEANRWVSIELLLPCRCDIGSSIEFKDKNGNKYKGYWNCGFITENTHCKIEDVIFWRYQESEKA